MLPTTETKYLYSSLADDPDLGEIVDLFVEEMPARVERLADFLGEGVWGELGRYAHQLNGACGSYGFYQLTTAAARLEHEARHDPDEAIIQDAFDDLAALCQRVRAGIDTDRRD